MKPQNLKKDLPIIFPSSVKKVRDLIKNLWPSQNTHLNFMHLNQQFTNCILSFTVSSRRPQVKKRHLEDGDDDRKQELRNFGSTQEKDEFYYYLIIYCFIWKEYVLIIWRDRLAS